MSYKRVVALLAISATPAAAQTRAQPVLDMHLHAMAATAQGPPALAMCPGTGGILRAHDPASAWADVFMEVARNPACADPIWSPGTDDDVMRRTFAVLERRNVIGITSGPLRLLDRWKSAAPDRILPAFRLNIGENAVTADSLRRALETGRYIALAEVTNQYSGIASDDPSFEPYLAIAEELDIPVGIHIGTGPPGAPYLGFGSYRARLHSPLTLEDALVRHPRLRVWIMHAGWPMLDDLLAVLWAHPQVHVDIGVIVFALPRVELYRYLRTIVEAGFGERVMFGSDQMVWPETIEYAIRVVEEAPFLSDVQKRDILYNNAARFLRLSESEIAQHHGR